MRYVLHAEGARLTEIERATAASGQVEALSVRFTFSADWAGTVRTAVFVAREMDGDRVYHVLLDDMDTCVVPAEVTANADTMLFHVGVFGVRGTKIITSTFVFMPLNKGAYGDGIAPEPPSADIYAQILDRLQELESITNPDGATLLIPDELYFPSVEARDEFFDTYPEWLTYGRMAAVRVTPDVTPATYSLCRYEAGVWRDGLAIARGERGAQGWQGAAGPSPFIGPDGTWWTYDAEGVAYDTGMPTRGETGESAVAGVYYGAEWDASTPYCVSRPAGEVGEGHTDSVLGPDGDRYAAIQDSVGVNPVGGTGYWSRLVSKGADGQPGTPGVPGAAGQDGRGVPPGGQTGQVLSKTSAINYETAWTSITGAVQSVMGPVVDNADPGHPVVNRDGTKADASALAAHQSDTANPHSVTLQQAADAQGAADTVLSGRLYDDSGGESGKYLTAGEIAGLYTSGVTYKGMLKYGAATLSDMDGIPAAPDSHNLTAGDACGVHDTQLSYVWDGGWWVEQPHNPDHVGDMYLIDYWYGTRDGKAYAGEVQAQIICRAVNPTVFDLYLDTTILLDGSVTTSKIADGAVTSSKLSGLTISFTLYASNWYNGSMSPYIPGIRANSTGIPLLAQGQSDTVVNAFMNAGLYVYGQDNNTLTIKAMGGVPAVDIPLKILVLG